MRLLFSFTLQSQKQIDECIRNINKSHIPISKCRFFYSNEDDKKYLESIGLNAVKSCGLSPILDAPLNTMRISKNRSDSIVFGLSSNSRITRYKDLESELGQFVNSLEGKVCLFSTSYLYPCKQHQDNHIDSRIIICKNAHRDMMNNYIDACEYLDKELVYELYDANTVLENMKLTNMMSINFNGLKNQSLFQQFLLTHFSDYDD